MVAIGLGASAVASAQPAVAQQPAPHKCESAATWMSVGGALLPPIIGGSISASNRGVGFAVGLAELIGPSAGHWYAEDWFSTGLWIRLAGTGLATVGLVGIVNCASDQTRGWCSPGLVISSLIAGSATYLVGIVYDIATAGRAARDWNASHRAVQVVPVPVASGAGVALAGAF